MAACVSLSLSPPLSPRAVCVRPALPLASLDAAGWLKTAKNDGAGAKSERAIQDSGVGGGAGGGKKRDQKKKPAKKKKGKKQDLMGLAMRLN